MMPADLDKRAELTVWPGHAAAHTAEGHVFPTLREALTAAVAAIEAEDVHPWIITPEKPKRVGRPRNAKEPA